MIADVTTWETLPLPILVSGMDLNFSSIFTIILETVNLKVN